MRSTRFSQSAAVLLAAALFGCGGPTENRVPAGSLLINATGLPATVTPKLKLTRISDQVAFDLVAGKANENIAAGDYLFTAESQVSEALTYDPQPASQNITITDGGAANLTVAYNVRSGSLNVSVTGLPAGVNADVVLTGPGSTKLTFPQSKTASAPIGSWRLTAKPLTHNGVTYTPSPANFDATVSKNATVNINVKYTGNAGSLVIDVTGLASGVAGAVRVTGPLGFSQTVTASTTLAPVPLGTYTLTTDDVTGGGLTYRPATRTRQVVVTSPDNPTQITIAYHGKDDLAVEFAYVTQAVQRQNQSITLVANRDALLRVFVTNNRLNSLKPKVRARIFDGEALVRTVVLDAPESSTRSSISESLITSTWNTVIEAEHVQPGLRVLVDVDPDNVEAEDDEANNVWPRGGTPRNVPVVAVPPFRVRFVPMIVGGQLGNVTEANRESYLTDLRRMFPVSEVTSDIREPFTSNLPALQPDNVSGWVSVVNEIAALRTADGVNDLYYYGVLKLSYTFGTVGIGFIGFPVAMGYDRTAGAANVSAHEWGHNFNRLHAPCGGPAGPDPGFPHAGAAIGVFGWNSSNNSLLLPSVPDIMGYCDPNWISDYTWTNVLQFRQSFSSVASRMNIASAEKREGLLVWGRVSNGATQLEPSFRVNAPISAPLSNTSHLLEALDRNGRVIASMPLATHAIDHAPNEENFATVLPWSEELERSLATIRVRDIRSPLRTVTRTSNAAVEPSLAVGDTPVLANTDEVVETVGTDRLRVRWNRERYPLAVARDVATGQILAFVREPGSVVFARDGRAVDLILSDGVRSTTKRVR